MDRSEIFFVAGEPSGDLHAAQLAAELLRRGDYDLTGAGGRRMREAGVRTDLDSSDWATIGLAQAFGRIPVLWTALRRTVQRVRQRRPALLVLVDFGGFNVRVARRVRSFPWHQPIMYYFPPSSWNKTARDRSALAALTDVVATPFRWSAELLRQDGVNAHYVGHPVLDEIAPLQDKSALRAALGVPPAARVVGLMPGSRVTERSLIAPQMWGAARLLAAEGSYHFLWSPGPPGLRDRHLVPADLTDKLTVVPRTADLVRAADLVMVAFGTATLEAAAALTPMVTVYRASAAGHVQAWLQRWPTQYYAMPNIVLDRALVPELTGRACDAAPLAAAVRELLDDPSRLAEMRQGLAVCREALGPPGAVVRTADLVLAALAESGGAR
jgi:lipid-A-disaccharide synthase